jgi:potassium channel subfamily K
MLQTILLSLYLALGGAIFSAIEGWDFVDAVYWADYTLLTIGLGTDFPVTRVGGRMLLLPYAAVGIVFVGLIIGSVRDLVVERAKTRITKRRLEKERERWESIIDETSTQAHKHRHGQSSSERTLKRFFKSIPLPEEEPEPEPESESETKYCPHHLDQQTPSHPHPEKETEHKLFRRREFELMRYIEKAASKTESYIALGFSVFVFLIVWVGGSLVFWACETNVRLPFTLLFYFISLPTHTPQKNKERTRLDIPNIPLLHLHLNPHNRLRRLLPNTQLHPSLLRHMESRSSTYRHCPHKYHGRNGFAGVQ